jgi:17beta-estradiol 17-dehydrogenase / very-long-chain 3-oxoacyl-CoA reductase
MFTIIGIIAVIALVVRLGFFACQHFMCTTDLKVYGAKQGAWAVITGASEGIGKGFALALAQKGFNIVIISRRVESLQPVADAAAKYDVQTKVVPLDCNSPDAVAKIVAAVDGLDVSVLVNNVGLNTRYPENLVDTPDNEIDNMINVNVTFTTKLTKAFIPILSKRKRSLIFNMSSFTGRVPVAMMSVYSATKSYVDVFSRALSAEVKQNGIDVTSVLPHYVVSVMSGIRKASWSIPEAIPFAHSALKQVSSGAYAIAPHWFHDISMMLIGCVPDAVIGKQTLNKMKFVRKRLIARDEREKKA